MVDQLLDVDQLRNMPPMEPVIDGLLDFDSVTLAYGARGAAKSFLGIDLCAHIASGLMWHGHPTTPAPALYVVAEGAAGFGVRYTAWQAAHYAEPLPRRRLVHLPTPLNLLSPSMVAEFADMAAELGSRFIVLDTLARCMVGGDENTAKDAGLAVEQLDEIRRATGACVFVIHHAGKDATRGGRGSSAFEAAADTVLEIGLTDAIMTVTCTKQKNHAEPPPARLRLIAEGPSAVLQDYLGLGGGVSKGAIKALTALSEIETAGGESASVWRLSSEMAESSFYRARQELVTLSLVTNIGSDKQPRYQVTPSGTLILPNNSQALDGSSPTPLPPHPPSIGGESGSGTNQEPATLEDQW
jgi:hypothetical protein